MVAIVVGAGTGLVRGSGLLLGSQGQLGTAGLGQADLNATVNAANGNLVIQSTDVMLFGVGLNAVVANTYNSEGTFTSNGWQANYQRALINLPSQPGSGSSQPTSGNTTLTHVTADGSEVVYTWEANYVSSGMGAYVANEGGGAYDAITFNSATSAWTWTDGATQDTDTYNAGGQLIASKDASGNTLNYVYGGGHVTSITTQSSFAGETAEFLSLSYNASGQLSSITTVYHTDEAGSSALTSMTDVTYGYTSGELTSETFLSGVASYTISYGYSGGLLTSIGETDGSNLTVSYGGSLVTSFSETATSGGTAETTTLSYGTSQTTITDPVGAYAVMSFNSAGELTQLTNPAGSVSSFTWDANYDVLSAKAPDGSQTVYTYDSNGDRTSETDGAGDVTSWTYNTASGLDQLLTETTYPTSSSPQTVHYVYDGNDRLEFEVSATGDVTQYVYNNYGEDVSEIGYTQNSYNGSSFTSSSLLSWTQSSTNLAATDRTDTTYDARGDVESITTYTQTTSSGTGVTSAGLVSEILNTAYLPTGEVLSRELVTPVSSGASTATLYTYGAVNAAGSATVTSSQVYASTTSETYRYDELGRQISSVDYDGLTTSTVFSYTTTGSEEIVTVPNGGTETSNFNLAGELTTYTVSGTGVNAVTNNVYDADDRLAFTIDPTGVVTSYNYNPNGQLAKTVQFATLDTNSSSWASLSAMQNWVTSNASAADAVTRSIYDADGRLAYAIDPAGYVTAYQYNNDGQVTKETSYSAIYFPQQDNLNYEAMQFIYQVALARMPDEPSWINDAGLLQSGTYTVSSMANVFISSGEFKNDMTRLGISTNSGYVAYFNTNLGLNFDAQTLSGYVNQLNSGTSLASMLVEFVSAGETSGATPISGQMSAYLALSASAAETTNTVYNGAGEVAYSIDPTGAVTGYVYDGDGRVTQETQYATLDTAVISSGATLSTMSAWAASTAGGVNSANEVTNTVYDDAGEVAYSIGATGAVTGYLYDANGDVTQETRYAPLDPVGSAGATLSSMQAWVQSSGGSNNDVTRSIYNANGQLLYSIDADGYLTAYQYDGDGQVTQENRYSASYFPQTGSPYESVLYLYQAALARAPDSGGWNTYAGDLTANQSMTTVAGYFASSAEFENDTRSMSTAQIVAYLNNNLGLDLSAAAQASFVSSVGSSSFYSSAGASVLSSMVALAEASGSVPIAGAVALYPQVDPSPSVETTNTVYNAAGQLAFSIDATGAVTGYAYDANGDVIQETQYATSDTAAISGATYAAMSAWAISSTGGVNSANEVTNTVYDADGRVAYSIDATGAVTGYVYSGDVVQETQYATRDTAAISGGATLATMSTWLASSGVGVNASNAVTTTVYSGGEAVFSIGATGAVTGYVYDLNGDVVQQTQYAVSNTSAASGTTLSAMQSWATSNATAPGNRVTNTVYDADGRVAFTIDPVGVVTGYTYDPFGNVIGQTRYANLDTAAISGTTLSAMQAWASGSGSSTSNEVSYSVYNGANELAFAIDPTGAVTGDTYDAFGDVVQTIQYATPDAVSSAPSLSAMQSWAAASANSAHDEITGEVYDADGRQIYGVDAGGYVRTFQYDSFGDLTQERRTPALVSQTEGTSATSAQVLSALGLISSATAETTTYVYDADGRVVFAIDPTGAVTSSLYNALGEVTQSTEYAVLNTSAASGTTLSAMQSWATSSAVVSAHNRTSYSVYDANGRVGYAIDPDGYVTATSYNFEGKITQVTRYGTPDAGVVSSSLTVSAMQSWVSSNANGAIDDTTSMTYDALGRVLTTEAAQAVSTSATSNTTSYAYDAFGDQIRITNALGGVTSQGFNGEGLMTSQTLPETSITAGGTVEATSVTTSYAYNAFGDKTSMVQASGLSEAETTSYTYDKDNRLLTTSGGSVTVTNSSTLSASQTTPVQQNVYDVWGNLVETIDAVGAKTFDDYNTRNQRIAEVNPDGDLTSATYNAFGDVTSQTEYATVVSGAVIGTVPTDATTTSDRTTSYTYDLDNRATSSTLENMVYGSAIASGSGSSTSASWTTSGAGVVTSSTVYDAFGDTVEQIDGDGNATYTYYDADGQKVAQVDPDNNLTSWSYDSEGDVLSEIQYATPLSGAISTSSIPAPPPVVTPASTANQITDPDFTNIAGNWGNTATSNPAISTSQSVTTTAGGVYVYTNQTSPSTIPAAGFQMNLGQAGADTLVPVTAGQSVEASAYVASTGASGVAAYIQWWGASGYLGETQVGVSAPSGGAFGANGLDGAYRIGGVAIAPAGATSAGLVVTGTAVGGVGLSVSIAGPVLRAMPNQINDPNFVNYTTDWANLYQTSSGTTQSVSQQNGMSVYTRATTTTPTSGYALTLGQNGGAGMVMVPVGASQTVAASVDVASTNASSVTLYVQYWTSGGAFLGQATIASTSGGGSFSSGTEILLSGTTTAPASAGYVTLEATAVANGGGLLSASIAEPELSVLPALTPFTAAGPNDRVTLYTYDHDGDVLTQTRENVSASTVNSATGALAAGAVNATISYTYDALRDVLTLTEATGDVTSYGYNSAGQRISQTDAAYSGYVNGSSGTVQQETITAYNGLGEVTRTIVGQAGTISATDAEVINSQSEHITESVYGSGGWLEDEIDAAGDVTAYGYDADGRVVTTTYGAATPNSSGQVQFSAGLPGMSAGVLQSNDPYDNWANVTSYDAGGNVLFNGVASGTATSSGGMSWTAGDQTDYAYNAFGEVSAQGTDGTYAEQLFYDNGGHVWLTNGGNGAWQVYAYDADGNQTLDLAAAYGGSESLSAYATPVSGGASASLLTALDAIAGVSSGNVTLGSSNLISASGVVATFDVYNRDGEKTATVEPLRQVGTSSGTTVEETIATSQTWDAFGDELSATDANGNTTSYVYNALGKQVEEIEPIVQIVTVSSGVSGALLVSSSGDPTLYTYYDASGREVGHKDANGNLTTDQLLAGTGYQGATASVAAQFDPDGGQVQNSYDVFGDARTVQTLLAHTSSGSGIYAVQQNTYDGADRLVEVIHPSDTLVSATGSAGVYQTSTGSGTVSLVDYYAYNGLGARIAGTNSELIAQTASAHSGTTLGTDAAALAGAGAITSPTTPTLAQIEYVLTNTSAVRETSDYDDEGRIVSSTDYDGYATDYDYQWSSSITNSGLNVSGGTVETITQTYGSSTTTTDYFGNEVAHVDYGGNSYAYSYNIAGQMVQQVGGANVYNYNPKLDNNNYQYLTFSYYNTGETATTIDDSGIDVPEYISGTNIKPPNAEVDTESTYTYDANGNQLTETYENTIMRYVSSVDVLNSWDGTEYTSAYESAAVTYDALNRISTMSWAPEPTISGATLSYSYDAQGNIAHMHAAYTEVISGLAATQDYYYTYDSMDRFLLTEGTLSGGYVVAGTTGDTVTYNLAGERVTDTIQVSGGGTQVSGGGAGQVQEELYAYGEDGYLDQVSISDAGGPAYLAATNTRDAMGRVTAYSEYQSSGGVAVLGRTDSYDNDSNIMEEIDTTVVSGATSVASTTYSYMGGVESTVYFGGNVVETTTSDYKISGVNQVFQSASETTYGYIEGDAFLENSIDYTPNLASSGTSYGTELYYDTNMHLESAYIGGAATATVTYVDNADGQIIGMTESATNNAQPEDSYYTFGGVRRGQTGNNGAPSNEESETNAINQAATNPVGNGYAYGKRVDYANFDENFAPVDPASNGQAQASQSYTVQAGDTLQSVAQDLWGDSSLWYLLADANGLSSGQGLVAGTVLEAPAYVTNVQNNSTTTQVYDQYQTLGNINPDQIRPPQHQHGCGIVGEIISSIISYVVTAVTGIPELGNIAGQLVNLADGEQSKFSWNSLAESAIADFATAGLDSVLPNTPIGLGLAAAGGQAVSQGVGVLTGMQKTFNWGSVAAAGVSAGLGKYMNGGPNGASTTAFSAPLNSGLAGAAGAFAGAATNTLTTHQSFGANLLEALPDMIGSIAGGAIMQTSPFQTLQKGFQPLASGYNNLLSGFGTDVRAFGQTVGNIIAAGAVQQSQSDAVANGTDPIGDLLAKYDTNNVAPVTVTPVSYPQLTTNLGPDLDPSNLVTTPAILQNYTPANRQGDGAGASVGPGDSSAAGSATMVGYTKYLTDANGVGVITAGKYQTTSNGLLQGGSAPTLLANGAGYYVVQTGAPNSYFYAMPYFFSNGTWSENVVLSNGEAGSFGNGDVREGQFSSVNVGGTDSGDNIQVQEVRVPQYSTVSMTLGQWANNWINPTGTDAFWNGFGAIGMPNAPVFQLGAGVSVSTIVPNSEDGGNSSIGMNRQVNFAINGSLQSPWQLGFVVTLQGADGSGVGDYLGSGTAFGPNYTNSTNQYFYSHTNIRYTESDTALGDAAATISTTTDESGGASYSAAKGGPGLGVGGGGFSGHGNAYTLTITPETVWNAIINGRPSFTPPPSRR